MLDIRRQHDAGLRPSDTFEQPDRLNHVFEAFGALGLDLHHQRMSTGYVMTLENIFDLAQLPFQRADARG